MVFDRKFGQVDALRVKNKNKLFFLINREKLKKKKLRKNENIMLNASFN